jgi:hypothetical protein
MSIRPVENRQLDFQLRDFHALKQAQKEAGPFPAPPRVPDLDAAV